MQTIGRPIPPQRRTSKPVVGATLIHAILLGTLIHWSSTPWVAPIRLPGSEHGSNLLLTYSPGRAPVQSAAHSPRTKPKPAETKSPLPKLPTPKVKDTPASPNTNSPVSAQPDSAAGADALGSGNINIALANYFPAPKPDLSSLPRGTRGDVIIDIVIDATGKISDLKMTSGLGHGIDETVIATVHQWTFHPATRDGQPIASEQELHFHYERG